MRTLFTVVVIAGVIASATTAPQQRQLTFKDVKPIFDKKCLPCHGAEYPGGNFRMNSYEAIMKGGQHGKAVIAKNSAGSRMMKMLKGTIQPRMPMDATPLSQMELEKISKWITQGARK
ncbi:MAG: c-type cytochrome domain-containing protein [Fimbriimonadales bacterium]